MFFCCLLSLSVLALQVSGQSLEESLQPGNGLNMLDGVELLGLRNSIPGEPGVDYPIYSTVPDTDFSCQGSVPGEYYADVATQCQVFHVCAPLAEGLAQRFSFLCPNGTMFHQQLKICHWWFYVDCESSAQFYKVNPELEDIAGRQDSTYGDSVDLEDSDYLFSPSIGDSAGGYNRRQFLRSRRFRPNNFRRIGNRAALLSDIRGTRQARFPRRRQLKAIPSSSFREDQNRKRISRQVESKRKKSDVTGKKIKNTSFEEDIQMLKKEILKALSFLK